ncbi:MAG: FHA domain-containing protein [Deltaproteobacteria bacterium]|nr:FHA domain-containing protein [Deltaproteobacteria bacterium]
MAAELECSVDYLINESMRQYAKSRRATSATIPPIRESIAPPGRPTGIGGIAGPPGGARPSGLAPPPSRQRLAPPPGPRPSSPPVPPPQAVPPMQTMSQPQVPVAQQQTQPPFMQPQPVQQAVPPVPVMDTDPMAQQQQAQPIPAAQPAAQPPVHATAGTMPTLYLIFNGQKIPITKDQFIIGRGLKTSDLAIKDGNISRKHAAIIYHNGAYYIKDLGSVNGIEYSGKRIDSKRIDEADMFHICDYELRFTYT